MLSLALVALVVLDLNGVLIVRIHTKNWDAAMCAKMLVSHFVAYSLTTLFWHDSDLSVA